MLVSGSVVGLFGMVKFRYVKWSEKNSSELQVCRYFLVGSWGDLFVDVFFLGTWIFPKKLPKEN